MILKYNAATSYALAIGLLSDRLGGAGGIQASWPLDEVPLDEFGRTTLQEGLSKLGFFDRRRHDGVLGRQSRAAIRAYQKARQISGGRICHSESSFTRVLNERALAK